MDLRDRSGLVQVVFNPQVDAEAFALADTLGSQDDSRALLAAASLQLARAEYVTATETRACPDVTRADSTLALSAGALERGVGNGGGATELTEVYGALRAAVDNAVKVLCRAP